MNLRPIPAQPSGDNPALGIVYVLTNPAMPGLVKIGRISQTDEYRRCERGSAQSTE